jgi:hypothetical protein
MDRLDTLLLIANGVLALAGTYLVIRKARQEDRPLTGADKTLIVVFALQFAFNLWVTIDPR